jgi:meso-butanediol dehydrogenase/(S,S)-butanediol dehydrogenase/diacetyl reductase
MSKHAVIGLTRVAAAEAAAAGIRVNAVLPSAINTGMMRRIEANSGEPAEYNATTDSSIPFGRYGEPDEVAALRPKQLAVDTGTGTGIGKRGSPPPP